MTPKERVLSGVALPPLLLIPIWLTTPLTEHNQGFDEDGFHYAAMALRGVAPPELPADLYETAPWCWRVLTPFLVSLLPFHRYAYIGVLRDFQVLAFASNWLSLVALYGLLRRSRIEPAACVLGVVLYAGIFWTIKFSVYSPTYVDFQAQMFLLLILYCLVARRYWATLVLLVLAVLQKETALLVIPVVATHYWHERRPRVGRDWLWLAAVLVLPTSAWLIVRASISPVADYSTMSFVLPQLPAQLADPDFWLRFLVAVFSGLGLLPLVLLYRFGDAWRYLRANPHWLVMLVCGAVMLFGGVDKARLFLPMTPVVVVLTAVVLGPLVRDRRPATIVWLGLTLLLHLYLGHHLAPMPAYDEYLVRMVPMHAGATVLPSLIHVGLVGAVWALATMLLGGKWFRVGAQT